MGYFQDVWNDDPIENYQNVLKSHLRNLKQVPESLYTHLYNKIEVICGHRVCTQLYTFLSDGNKYVAFLIKNIHKIDKWYVLKINWKTIEMRRYYQKICIPIDN